MPADQSRHASLLHEAVERFRLGDAPGAVERCREALRSAPDDTRTLRLLSVAYLSCGQPGLARESAGRGLRIRPGDPDLLQALAAALAREGEFDRARGAIDGALAARPGDPTLVATLADLHFKAGRFAEAGDVLDAHVKGVRHIGLALSFAQVAPRLGREREGVEFLEAALGESDQPLAYRVNALFSLGGLYDSLKEHDRAFDAYERANRLKGSRPDAEAYFDSIDRMVRAWSLDVARAVPRSPQREPAPVFIVGMPRSGTSLTEQILASHPDVFGAGERDTFNRLVGEIQQPYPGLKLHLLNPEAVSPRGVERMSRAALRDLRGLAPKAKRIIDKNPVNYLHLGLIAAVFPGARVLHCVRDPLDTCLSGYFHNLAGPHVMAGDLAQIGRWHNAYRRVVSHWKSVLELPVMDVVYEEMVADQEGVSRRIVEFLGLDWREEMLLFHENRRPTLTPSVDQVRRPMYTSSVQRWRNYEKHLGPLRAVLKAEPR